MNSSVVFGNSLCVVEKLIAAQTLIHIHRGYVLGDFVLVAIEAFPAFSLPGFGLGLGRDRAFLRVKRLPTDWVQQDEVKWPKGLAHVKTNWFII